MRTKGIIIAFDNTVGRVASHISFLGSPRSALPSIAPIRVARVPNITSQTSAPVRRFARKQPSVTPITASGIRSTSTVSASERRT